jgi:hypothetical protein
MRQPHEMTNSELVRELECWLLEEHESEYTGTLCDCWRCEVTREACKRLRGDDEHSCQRLAVGMTVPAYGHSGGAS